MFSYTVAVRDLVEFVCRTGDLGRDRSFSSLTRATEGIDGHKRIQDSRPDDYVREFAVQDVIARSSIQLKLRGRIDGYWRKDGALWLEEIKTRTRPGSPAISEASVHWAQAKIYGALLLRHLEPPNHSLRLQITYLNLPTNALEEHSETWTRADLELFYTSVVSIYLDWLTRQSELVDQRDQSLETVPFPFPHFRPGQRNLAELAYRTALKGGRAFSEAPTGIGKTISTLFPALKAMRKGGFRRLIYLTAKTPGRTIAENAVRELQSVGARVRSITLTARSRLCTRNGSTCDLNTCPLAIGYFDRRHKALGHLLSVELITRSVIENVGCQFMACPYALSMDIAPWMDVVIGDYNHLFDPRSRLGFLGEEACEAFVLVDEAHNLVDRSREMFSASLSPEAMDPVRKQLKPSAPSLAKALAALERSLRSLLRARRHEAAPHAATSDSAFDDVNLPLPLFESPPPSHSLIESRAREKGNRTENLPPAEPSFQDWSSSEQPTALQTHVEHFASLAAAWLTENTEHVAPRLLEDLVGLYFESRAWLSASRRFDGCYVTLFETGTVPRVTLFCLDPSIRLRETLDSCSGAIFFSATLSPLEYFRTLCGGDEADRAIALPSPFPQDNFRVLVNDSIQTTYRARANTLEQVADFIASFVKAHVGNYMAFFPSHRYLGDVLERFQSRMPGISVAIQEPRMTEEERAAFLALFEHHPESTRVGFAVMGGIFGEGIDLVGDRLSGAIVVGVGLPQLSFKRNVIRDYFENSGRPGFEFAYVFPGINRVIQAAGRVVRSETDRGMLLLIDARFREPRYKNLLPAWWTVRTVRHAEDLHQCAIEFWKPNPE